jgi:hypothetical protein
MVLGYLEGPRSLDKDETTCTQPQLLSVDQVCEACESWEEADKANAADDLIYQSNGRTSEPGGRAACRICQRTWISSKLVLIISKSFRSIRVA